jgi:hypothetical protein
MKTFYLILFVLIYLGTLFMVGRCIFLWMVQEVHNGYIEHWRNEQ